MTDLRKRYLLWVVVLNVLGAFDAVMTYYHINHGAEELNPVMARLIGYGWTSFFAFKLASGLFFLFIILKIDEATMRKTVSKALVAAILLAYVGLACLHVLLLLVTR